MRFREKVWVMLVLVALTSLPASAQNRVGTGTLIVTAPMFLLPDATRTPLATLPAGTVVRVQAREGEWYRVIFHDAYLGDRTGYIQAANVRVDALPPAPPGSRPRASPVPQRSAPGSPARAAPRHPFAPWAERGDLSINGLYQTTSNPFSATTTLTRNVEQGSVTTAYGAGHPPVLDIGIRALAARNLAVGGVVTWTSQSTNGAVSASLPHPFFFNALRRVSGEAAGLRREEVDLHLQVSGLVPIGRTVQLAVFAGPSYFHLSQDLVTDVNANETYPFDTATFASAVTATASKGKLGFNAGVDVAGRIARHIGVGFTARYGRSTIQLPVTGSDDVSVRVGGLQVGAGFRFGF